MSDFLSQDQIDSLLQQQEKGAFEVSDIGESSAPEQSTTFEPDYNALSAACDLFNAQASPVFSTVLNKTTKCNISACQAYDGAVLQNAIDAPALSVGLSFDGKVSGTWFCFLEKKRVAFVSDLMMMGDGSAEYTEDHKDAVSELFNQIMGAFTVALGEKCGGTVTAKGNAEAADFDYVSLPYSSETADMAISTIKVAESDEFSFGIIIPKEFSHQLMGYFKEAVNINAETAEQNIPASSSEAQDMSDLTSHFTETDDAQFPPAGASGSGVQAPRENIEMLLDIELDVSIELGRADLSIKKILELAPGSIVELERMAGEPVDLMVNNRVVAKGEVVIVDENFGIRIVSLVSPEERIKSLR